MTFVIPNPIRWVVVVYLKEVMSRTSFSFRLKTIKAYS
jgi:hypothetical protein